MKSRIHLLGAGFGLVCAVAFSLAPFMARADSGPKKFVAAPDSTPSVHATKRHMHRGNVGAKDDGCGS